MEVLQEERTIFSHALGFVGVRHGGLGMRLALSWDEKRRGNTPFAVV